MADELEALIARCGTGDAAAFRLLYDLQSARLYGIALRLTRRPVIAADVVHDTMLQVWRNGERFDSARGTAAAWLATLLRYRAIDALRRDGLATVAPATPAPEAADDAPDPLAVLAERDEAAALRACLDRLDAPARGLVVMSFFDGRTHADLAQATATPLGTVKSRLRRALMALRRCLEGDAA